MQYKYVKEQPDYSDLASGKVFYSLPGHPAFPIRLASEIFLRCVEDRKTIYKDVTPCVLYDPCCGAAYHLSVLAYLHGKYIREVIASDVNEKAVAVAEQNLGLLDVNGLDKRIEKIKAMLEKYNKDSHKDALKSAQNLKEKLSRNPSMTVMAFQANVMNNNEISNNVQPGSVDIVFTDIPYGQHSNWQYPNFTELFNPLHSMLDSLLGTLSATSIVAIVSDKQQKVSHENYQRIEHFQVGKRRIVILKPV
jgi:23S rRNA (guanine2535-N1)-methyltransferase